MAKHICVECQFIYDDDQDYSFYGIPAGTKWEDLPEDFECLSCGRGKESFQEFDH